MKKILSIIFIVICLLSCKQPELPTEPVTIVPAKKYKINGHTISTYVIDGCEYLGNFESGNSRDHYMTHKGDCENPKHNIHDTIYLVKENDND